MKSWAAWNRTPEAAAARSKGGRSTPHEVKVEQGKQITAMRFSCSECGMVSNPLALGRHQKASGHEGRSRA